MIALDLNKFRAVRRLVLNWRRRWLVRSTGARIHETSTVSTSARLVGGADGAIEIGAETLVALKSLIIAREADGTIRKIRIGRRCFIGGGAIILPGVIIGDEVIVGAGAVVMADIPPRCAVGGNPARILRRDIEVGSFGRLTYADDNQRKNVI